MAERKVKIVILYEQALTELEQKLLHVHYPEVVECSKFHLSRSLTDILARVDVFTIDLKQPEYFQWWAGEKQNIGTAIAIYKHKTGVEIDDAERLKLQLGVRHVIKRMPQAENKLMYTARLLADHISSKVLTPSAIARFWQWVEKKFNFGSQ